MLGRKRWALVSKYVLLAASFTAGLAHVQRQESHKLDTGEGTLGYTATVYSGHCGSNGAYKWTEWGYTNLIYEDPNGNSVVVYGVSD